MRQRIVLFSLVAILALLVGWNIKTLGPFYYGLVRGWLLAQSQSPSPDENPAAPVVSPQPTVRATGSVPANDTTVPEGTTVLEETTTPEETTALEETTGFQAPEGTQASSMARMVCLKAAPGASSPLPYSTEAFNYYKTLNSHYLTRVLTPKVAAHPDGVHIQIDNRLDGYVSYETDPDYAKPGLTNKGLPEGKSIQVTLIPPGTAKIACESEWSTVNHYAYFEVVEGDSGYKSLELECKPGAEPRFSSMIASADRKFELVSYHQPVEEAREYYEEGLKEGDVVEPAGYPKDPNPTVRVVRDGKVIATHWSASMEMYATYCDGQI